MANINITETKYISSGYTGSKSGEGVGYGNTIKLASAQAKSDAINDATSAANITTGWSWAQGGGNSSNNRIGISVGSAQSPTYGTAWAQPSWNPETEPYVGYCTWSVTKPGNITEVHLLLNIDDLNVNNIASASLKITYTGHSSSTHYICAFKNNATINDYYYTRGSNNFESTRATFTPSQNNSPITIDVTEVLKKAVANNKNRLVIINGSGMGDYTNYIIPSAFELTYVENTSACGAPTSITKSQNCIIPGHAITITWSGAQAGTNNAITGYRIYWGTSSSFAPGNGVIGYYDFSSTATSGSEIFSSATAGTFPGVNNRGTTYYFKMCTKGTVQVDNAWYSSISGASTTLKVNTLPSVPAVTTDYNRLKSTGNTKVTFTVTPGSDNDNNQNYTTYYAESIITPTINNTTLVDNDSHKLSPTLNAAKTYYFWTYDGYEFSSNYTKIELTKSTKPTITSINVSNANEFTPSVSAGNATRKFVTQINASSNYTLDPRGSLTYNWYIKVGNIANSITWGSAISISNNEILNNFSVAKKVGNFGKVYKVGLTITDDIGESASAESDQIYAIPNPNIFIVNNNLGTSDIGNSNYFGRYIRIVQSVETSGIDKNLLVYNNNNNILNQPFGNGNIDIDLNQCVRNSSYDFKVQYSCDGLIVNNIITRTLKRALDITPTITSYAQQYSASTKDGIHPYTDNYFSYTFNNVIPALTNSNNVSTNFSDVYKIKLLYSDRELELQTTTPESFALGSLTASGKLIDDNTLSVEKWIQLINNSGSSAPIGSINLNFIIIAYNIFGESFPSNLYTIPFKFIEAFTFVSEPVLQLRMEGTSPKVYEQIPVNTSHTYPLFEDEIIKFSCAINSIRSYINTTCYLQLSNGNTILKSITINSTDWTRINGNSYLYQLNILKEIEYLIPKITANVNIDYKIKIIYNNNSYNSYYGESVFSNCKLIKIDTSSVNFTVENINETTNNSSKTITITYKFTNNGGGTGAYNVQKIQFKYSTNIMASINDYINLGTAETLTVSQNTQSYSATSTDIIGDVLYIGAVIILTPAYQQISNKKPYIESSINTNHYQIIYIDTNNNVIYRSTPNLLYGKNFFALNTGASSLGPHTDGVLYIHENNTRGKIYFGSGDYANFEITSNGLIIDGGSWS